MADSIETTGSAEAGGAASRRYERYDGKGSMYRIADFSGSTFINTDFSGSEFRGVAMIDVEITGEFRGVTMNGVEVGPLIEAELDRRYPLRVKLRPTDPAGFREAWDIVERLWDETVEHARSLPPHQLDASVNDEWSFLQTLRHLVMATDKWIGAPILHDPDAWSPLGLDCDESFEVPATPPVELHPSFDDVLALRRDRMAKVRALVDGLTDAQLDAEVSVADRPEARQSWQVPVRKALSVILNEEWEHRLFAERDLAILESGAASGS